MSKIPEWSAVGPDNIGSVGKIEPADILSEGNAANAETLAIAYSAWLCLLLDSPCYDPNGFTLKLSRWRKLLCNLHYAQICSVLDLVALRLMRDESPLPLKRVVDPVIWKALPIHRELFLYSESQDPQLLSYLLTFCNFCKKLQYDDDKLEAKALESWKKTDLALDESDLLWADSPRAARLRYASQSILRKFDRFNPAEASYSHGPGHVSQEGYRDLIKKASLSYYWEPYVCAVNSWYDQDEAYDFMTLVGHLYLERPSTVPILDWMKTASRLIFVPKSWKAVRSICCEPAGLMFWQQGLRAHFYTQLDRVMKHAIDLSNQSVNRARALVGSRDGSLSTVDLSSASDTVSERLVRLMFSDERFGELVLAARSTTTELPDGTIWKQRKFAPMGSALCFPVQCVVFFCVAALAYEESGEDIDDVIRGKPRYYHPISVYGDDLIFDVRLHDHVIELLEYFGFYPNVTKSFGDSTQFRESCGGWYRCGVDVTPFMLKLADWRVRSTTLSTRYELQGFIDAINRSGEMGYKSVRLHLRKVLNSQISKLIKPQRFRGRNIHALRAGYTRTNVNTAFDLRTKVRKTFNMELLSGHAFRAQSIVRKAPWYGEGAYSGIVAKIPKATMPPSEEFTSAEFNYEKYRYYKYWSTKRTYSSWLYDSTYILPRPGDCNVRALEQSEPTPLRPTVPKTARHAQAFKPLYGIESRGK